MHITPKNTSYSASESWKCGVPIASLLNWRVLGLHMHRLLLHLIDLVRHLKQVVLVCNEPWPVNLLAFNQNAHNLAGHVAKIFEYFLVNLVTDFLLSLLVELQRLLLHHYWNHVRSHVHWVLLHLWLNVRILIVEISRLSAIRVELAATSAWLEASALLAHVINPLWGFVLLLGFKKELLQVFDFALFFLLSALLWRLPEFDA